MFPEGAELAYSVIPKIAGLSPELRAQTQKAFADSLHLVWVIMLALCGAGMLSVALIKEFPLRKTTDKQWGLKEKSEQQRAADQEASMPASSTAEDTGTPMPSEGQEDKDFGNEKNE